MRPLHAILLLPLLGLLNSSPIPAATAGFVAVADLAGAAGFVATANLNGAAASRAAAFRWEITKAPSCSSEIEICQEGKSTPLQQALIRAEKNRAELERALDNVPPQQKAGMVFLIENMPTHDLRSLTAKFLAENVALAYEACDAVTWGADLPTDVFLNAVLPYAQINERRDNWRADFHRRFLPLIKGCETPGEAALQLNQSVFGAVEVKYSTKRKKPDQSPYESMEIGLASCTGLSILLADACRACGVPARLAGTANWFDKRGNHTWVEVWTDGEWHFLGAAEPDKRGLDHGWFAGDAARAQPNSREHGIFAAHWAATGTALPMVWAEDVDWVPAVEVTQRYLPQDRGSEAQPESNAPHAESGKDALPASIDLLLAVLDSKSGERIIAEVVLRDPQTRKIIQRGHTRDESSDANDFLVFQVPPSSRVILEIKTDSGWTQRLHECVDAARQTLHLQLNSEPASGSEAALTDAAAMWFLASDEERSEMKFGDHLDRMVQNDEALARRAVWSAFCAAPLHFEMKKDFDAKRVRSGKHESPYTIKTVGARPANGWPLFIAMHGGGGAPQEVNDSQWDIMQRYYKDQTDLSGGYKYLALRAPNNTWNGFYDDYVYPLIERLIQQNLLYNDVDADKVFLMGYSHGGYGAFAIGPKIPYRFAAVHASAAAPTDGQTSARTLRNTVFTFMIGEHDTAYGREERCQEFWKQVLELRGDRTDIYPVTLEWKKGHKHGGLPDRDKISSMYDHLRNTAPTELSWEMTDSVVNDFYWLQCDDAARGKSVEAKYVGNNIELKTEGVTALKLCLDQRLVALDAPLTIQLNGVDLGIQNTRPSLKVLCESMLQRGDPQLAYTMRMAVPMK